MKRSFAAGRMLGRGPLVRRLAITSAIVATAAVATQAHAQYDTYDTSIRDLPRPGYEPREIYIGTTIISPEAEIGGLYDNNVFATSTAKADDFVFRLAPSVRLRRDTSNLRLRADAYASILRYAENDSEDTESYGIGANARYTLDNTKFISTAVRYDRTFERRTDPEADLNLARPPSNIDILSAEYGYEYRPGRIGVSGAVNVVKTNFLPADEADRDMVTYRSSIRGSVRLSGRLDVFGEGYANRRDNRTAVDRNGVDRDTTTWGILGGTRVDIADRLQGELGLGFFRAMPDDPTTPAFSGLSANGRLTWRPRVRTAVTGEFFSGDVATVRAGATGRIDTRFGLRVDQEVRHNFILRAGVSLRNTSYRGSVSRNQTTYGGEVGGEYLLNRNASVTLNTSYAKRTADLQTDEFSRFQVGLGVRIRY